MFQFDWFYSKQKSKRSRQSSLASISQNGSQSSGSNNPYNNNNDSKVYESTPSKESAYAFAIVPQPQQQQRPRNGSTISLMGSSSAETLASRNNGGVEVSILQTIIISTVPKLNSRQFYIVYL